MTKEYAIFTENSSFPQYGMFSDYGNHLVDILVCEARKHKWSWPVVRKKLQDCADTNLEYAGEARDTMVRESVYMALGFDISKVEEE